ncbi:DMT family transporter [Tateyamaria sp. ANG-S1]|uniref:DMT family transporter n=1 Tax=Tateyamaria sp. ANG-S1 TaxID=1577905 RepID=UPI00057DD4CC|nr:DMT family transporter [Tateyamaria sp. ANG-S1]KIC47955.1 membrane protein [Tateyamaria sp. ANG-S1]
METTRQNIAGLGILFVLIGVVCISVNDMLIKELSGDYPLHQIVFARAGIGILFSLIVVQYEGGFGILRTDTPWQHALRGILIVIANMTFFVGLAVLPLADVTALFFVAPLFITLLSIPILGERVGVLRLTAMAVGFVGVVVMQRPWADADSLEVSRFVLALPVLAALTYALNQILTRKLGVASKASAMAVYIQGMFILVSVAFFVVAGGGRFAEGATNGSVIFLLRAWIWPQDADLWLFLGLGLNSAIVVYCLSQAYRIADAATVAPFEYVGLPLAVFWGWVVFGELPTWEVGVGIVLILGAGLFVFLRERQKAPIGGQRPAPGRRG